MTRETFTVITEPEELSVLPEKTIATFTIRSNPDYYSTGSQDESFLSNTRYWLSSNGIQDLSNISLNPSEDTVYNSILSDLESFRHTDPSFYELFIQKINSSKSIDLTKCPIIYKETLSLDHAYAYDDVIDQTLAFFSDSSNIDNACSYPHSVRYISNNGTLYIERPPFKVQLNFVAAKAGSSKAPLPQYEIWVPWTITELPLLSKNTANQNIRLYFSSSPLETLEDSKYIPCLLPNSYTDGNICFSNSLSELDIEHSDINYIYSMIVNEYMSGGWNLDLGIPVLLYSGISRSNDSDISDITYEYWNPTYNSLSKRFPDLTEKNIDTLISQCKSDTPSSHSIYYFKMMSGMTLEETLSFIKDIQNKYGKSFSKIYSSEQALPTTFQNLNFAISSRYLNHPVYVQNIPFSQKDIYCVLFDRPSVLQNRLNNSRAHSEYRTDTLYPNLIANVSTILSSHEDNYIFFENENTLHFQSHPFDVKRFLFEVLYENCFSPNLKESFV